MFKKSTWLHLRIPFSYFLMPIFFWGLSISPNLNEAALAGLFIILHFFIYPASNAFNSYYDKDEGSIGGLKNPPKVDKHVFYIAQIFDVIGLLASFLLFSSLQLTIMILVYVLVSRAYSHPSIRLKKYPIISWVIAGFFQGAWVVWIIYLGLNAFEFSAVLKPKVLFAGLLASAILWGSYPMTQIYQHKEDAARGDRTLSILLGQRMTFVFTAVFFALASLAFVIYFNAFFELKYGWLFLSAMTPVLAFFSWWFWQAVKNAEQINYQNTMRLNFISATCLSAFFIYFFLEITQVLNVVGVY